MLLCQNGFTAVNGKQEADVTTYAKRATSAIVQSGKSLNFVVVNVEASIGQKVLHIVVGIRRLDSTKFTSAHLYVFI